VKNGTNSFDAVSFIILFLAESISIAECYQKLEISLFVIK